MTPNYLVGYTLYSKFGFKTQYRHFETIEEVKKFIHKPRINESMEYVLYKSIKIEEGE